MMCIFCIDLIMKTSLRQSQSEILVELDSKIWCKNTRHVEEHVGKSREQKEVGKKQKKILQNRCKKEKFWNCYIKEMKWTLSCDVA